MKRRTCPLIVPVLALCMDIFHGVHSARAAAEEPLTKPSISAGSSVPAIPLTRAHAHNDYEHARPLLDALDNGFCSIEADVHLVGGQLLVAHDLNKTKPDRTLKALYLDPLRQRAQLHGGRIYPHGPVCWLFVDLKTEAEATYAALHEILARYSDLVTQFEGDRATTNAIIVVVTGNRPRQTIAAQRVRFAACDGLMADLDSAVSPLLAPVVSEQWTLHFKWRGSGPMASEDRLRLALLVGKARASHRLLRFWAAPDREEAWRILNDAGVDLVNTDNLTGLGRFLLSEQKVETVAGWKKYPENPVLGGNLGTCFDVALLRERGKFRMWFSWRPKQSVALVESPDGIKWSEPVIVLGPNPESKWEDDINRPVVVQRSDGFHLWYTGQARGQSWLGYATSQDGVNWKRASAKPVLSPDQPWEKAAVMCPHVIWDVGQKLFRMWYSGGEQYEPDAIGYATSLDGLNWTKHPRNPIFAADRNRLWEQHKVTACQVVEHGGWHYMFYIGFRDVDHAQIGLARSRDGISGWQRLAYNPIISPGENKWDHDACYKPFVIFDGQKWLLWYNGRRGNVEQIGLAVHEGEDLGFGP